LGFFYEWVKWLHSSGCHEGLQTDILTLKMEIWVTNINTSLPNYITPCKDLCSITLALKIPFSWDMTLCCWASSSLQFEGLQCLQLQGQAVNNTLSKLKEPLTQWHIITCKKNFGFSRSVPQTSQDWLCLQPVFFNQMPELWQKKCTSLGQLQDTERQIIKVMTTFEESWGYQASLQCKIIL
jgi:hypothetical protein